MVDNCSEKAANWWADKIEAQSNRSYIPCLDEFEQQLAIQIKELSNIHGSIIISTSVKHSKLLDELAFSTGMCENIPKGYDMNVALGHIYIYYHGNLISEL